MEKHMSFLLSEGINYHITNKIPIRESVYRPGSIMFFEFIIEAKKAFKQGLIHVDKDDQDLLSTDIGEYGIYNERYVPLDYPILAELDDIGELEEKRKRKKKKSQKKKSGSYYKGKKVKLNKPQRGGTKKFRVYVRNPKTGNIKKIDFGAPGMSVGANDPARRKSFAARHRCEEKNDKTKAGYWACRILRYPKLFGKTTGHKWW